MFELVFEGPVDESAETLRLLKGVFISDLDMSIDQVREILAHAPITIKQSESLSELEKNQGALQKAGAKVLIVQPDFLDDEEGAEPGEEVSFEFEFDGEGNLSNGRAPAILDEPDESHEPPHPEEIDSLLAQLSSQTILEKPEPSPLPQLLQNQLHVKSETEKPAPAPILEVAAPAKDLQLAPVVNLTKQEPVEQVPPPAVAATVQSEQPQLSQPATLQLESIKPNKVEASSQKMAAPPLPEPDEQTEAIRIPEAPKPLMGKLAGNFTNKSASAQGPDNKKKESAKNKEIETNSDVENREQVLSVEILLPRNKKRFSFPVEAILSAMIAVVVLCAGNYVIMSRQQKIATSAALDHYMMRLANPETPTERQPVANPKVAPAPASEQTTINGHNTTEEQEIISRFVADNNNVASMVVHLVSRGKAPELTPEQLVHHDQVPLWINRVDADDFEVTQLAGGKFIARGKAKVFVEQDKNRRRIAAKATVTGTYDSEQHKISATLRLDRGTFETFPGSSAIERSGDGTERLTLSVPINAEEVEQAALVQ